MLNAREKGVSSVASFLVVLYAHKTLRSSFTHFSLAFSSLLLNPCRCPILSGLLCLFLILGLGPICDEFRTWASNFVCFYFIESLSRLVLVILFRVYFVSSYLSLNVILCSFCIMSYFSYLFTLIVIYYLIMCCNYLCF